MNARSLVGKLSLAFFQWKNLVILLFVAGLYVQSLYYSVMKSRESQAEKRLGACRKRFVWRKPFLGSLWCQRCIVVGNGYSIHGQRFGKMIDSHHVIIRLNDAPVKEHKKDVGERTSIRLFFPESALPNPLENNDNETLMVFVPFKPLDFLWLREVLLKTRNKTKAGFWRQPPWEWNGNVSHLRILNPYVTYEATYKLLQLKTWSRRYATTGIIALNLALHMCQEVNIAGFGYPGNHDNATPIHYYNTGRSREKELIQHNLTAERNWLLKMIKQGVIADITNPSFQAQNH
ncbi:CMP-N-acetylneuraminate-beta-galactosamide-alpha-2,3-sialyltransferase 4-like isoform X5 [Apteryx rowi]|uniref:CMP-N-acetylneuraminate-beta-galactosamide- alpha-2,3-sialyltransferase 4-like isoform X5 n=1 Tax=Apteryx rowi TaxID=308060 RepID=UPI000E1CF223|nr:CMP-N-acetylneuraminate-beta-galactosamide-alpha-2,3-sialyltransferase 4-like isoform X5 [Apteryx rowi]